jgi:putative DNA primase/helicase
MMAAGPSLLDAALSYASRGWHVFPCHTPTATGCSCRRDCGRTGKHPRTKNGLKDATTNETTIRRWWKMWPQANIGIATGAGSGLVVLDNDTYKGGDESLSDLEQSYGPLSETVQQLTGGGGLQYFFAHPGTPVKNGVERLGPGLDIRGDGGYVIAPPSLHASGKRYAWELSHHPDETVLVPLPPWLLALCQAATRRTRPDAGAPIPHGQRNDTLFKLGASLRARGCTEAVILAALRAMNATQCCPPLDDAEVTTVAASCAQYPAGQSRQDARQRQNGSGAPLSDPWLGPRSRWHGVPLAVRRVVP